MKHQIPIKAKKTGCFWRIQRFTFRHKYMIESEMRFQGGAKPTETNGKGVRAG
jgi:hypothetical protein